MGACRTGGSPIDWTMRCEGVSFRHAVELLCDGVAPSVAPRDGRVVRSTVKKLSSPLQAGADERELMERVVAFYAQTLKESPQALGYLEGRGLVHPELLERFRLGYANRTLGYRLPAKNRKAGEQLRGSLQRLGVLRESGHEHLSGSLVIPVCDEHGTVVQLYVARFVLVCGRVLRFICICRVRVAGCSTARRWVRSAMVHVGVGS
jgi:DNA primase